MRQRKILKNRCPECGSSQIHYRKLIGNWICDVKSCKTIFIEPKSD